MMVGWMWLGPTLIVVGLLIIGYTTVRLVQRSRGAPDDAGASARRILDERFARGEIDEGEYRRRRSTLR